MTSHRTARAGRAASAPAILAIFYFGWTPEPPWLDTAFIVLATVAAWLFCIVYALLSRGAWIRTRFGRHLMILTGALAALGTHSIAQDVWTGPWPAWLGTQDFHRDVIYGVLTYQLINRVILMVASQVRGERRRQAELMRPTRPPDEHTYPVD